MKNLIMTIAAVFGFNYAIAQEPVMKQKKQTITKDTTTSRKAQKGATKKIDTVTSIQSIEKKQQKISATKDTVSVKDKK